jgi:hypothetical protein
MPQSIIVPERQVCLASTRSRHPSVGMATARLGQADLSLQDHGVAWHAIDLIGSRVRGTATGQPSVSLVRLTPMGGCFP